MIAESCGHTAFFPPEHAHRMITVGNAYTDPKNHPTLVNIYKVLWKMFPCGFITKFGVYLLLFDLGKLLVSEDFNYRLTFISCTREHTILWRLLKRTVQKPGTYLLLITTKTSELFVILSTTILLSKLCTAKFSLSVVNFWIMEKKIAMICWIKIAPLT